MSLQEQGTPQPVRILLMEDEDDQRRLYVRALTQAGFAVEQAATLQEARALLANRHFDVLICDIRMGNERGTDLLREEGPHLMRQGTEIIVLSAQEQYRALCQDLGVDFFITKPVSLIELTTLIRRLTGREQ
ncbi:MAG: response regulator [Ardenticatenia bacterium]|nr:response regulator [Ardenticatenia bacterium]